MQSPWAYRFIRYVINEHYPYYSYEDLRLRWFRIDVLSRKMAELLFRIAIGISMAGFRHVGRTMCELHAVMLLLQ